MVWWINKYEIKHCRAGARFGYPQEFLGDRICQTINIIFDFHHKLYTAFEIQELLNTGVNVFIVDRTTHDREFFDKTVSVIHEAVERTNMYLSHYYQPVAIAVTISALKSFDIDDKVDFVIVKDITNKEQFLTFRKRYKNFSSMPILIWLSEMEMEGTEELIKVSDGVVIDLRRLNNFTNIICPSLLQICKKAFKSIIYVKPSLVEDYQETVGSDRQVVIVANQLVDAPVDGVIIVDSKNVEAPVELVLSLVKAICAAETRVDSEKDYFKASFELKTPVLPPFAVAMAASLAALKIKAGAIIVLTTTGRSARILSHASPPCLILAITAKKDTARRLHLYRMVMPLFFNEARAQSWQEECRNRVYFGTSFALKNGLLDVDAKLVVLAQSEECIGYCDSFQIVNAPLYCN